MNKLLLFGLLIFGVVMCNQTSESESTTFIKVCRYNCDSVLICKTYLFAKMDSVAMDSFKKAGLNTDSYIGNETTNYQISPFGKKDTITFILNR